MAPSGRLVGAFRPATTRSGWRVWPSSPGDRDRLSRRAGRLMGGLDHLVPNRRYLKLAGILMGDADLARPTYSFGSAISSRHLIIREEGRAQRVVGASRSIDPGRLRFRCVWYCTCKWAGPVSYAKSRPAWLCTMSGEESGAYRIRMVRLPVSH